MPIPTYKQFEISMRGLEDFPVPLDEDLIPANAVPAEDQGFEAINDKLYDATEEGFKTVEVAIGVINAVLVDLGIVIPSDIVFHDDTNETELVFALNSDDTDDHSNSNYYLYLYWSFDEAEDLYDMHAEIVNQSGLKELLALTS